MNLIIDIGNTRSKAAVFKEDTLIKVIVFDKKKIVKKIKKIILKYPISSGIISSVGLISDKKIKTLKKITPFIELSATTKVPFINLYKTPSTLGVDRIALATASLKNHKNKNVLIIDAGTCITFDFINSKKEYLGGAISLGIKMRFKALHKYTANLPLLDIDPLNNFIGNTTETSINSGVINGVYNEIEGVIEQYKKKYTDLTVVLTGGDTNFLAEQLKSSIFANPNFLLEGLNEILNYNKD